MSDELLPYYNRELAHIRYLGAEFAQAYPKIAARLRLGTDSTDDPHVARLIEAFAYLNAHIRHKLDDDFPELTDALLGALYPHYLAPVPAMAVVQFTLDPSQVELTGGFAVAAGTALDSDPGHGEVCRFRTCYPVELWPLEVAAASLSGPPFPAPRTPYSRQSASALRLALRCSSPSVRFADLPVRRLRFFLRAQTQHVYPLYELIFNARWAWPLPGRRAMPLRRCLVRNDCTLSVSARTRACCRTRPAPSWDTGC
jgi:type VI secretion system protein ImpG